jgi:hypothetical protein
MPKTPVLNYEFTVFINETPGGHVFNYFLYENEIKFKKECHPEMPMTFYLSNEPNCSPVQSSETITLILLNFLLQNLLSSWPPQHRKE